MFRLFKTIIGFLIIAVFFWYIVISVILRNDRFMSPCDEVFLVSFRLQHIKSEISRLEGQHPQDEDMIGHFRARCINEVEVLRRGQLRGCDVGVWPISIDICF